MTIVHRWSVTVFAEGDREVTHDEVVELADAVAGMGGIATGIGQHGYGAQIVVAAGTRAEALSVGTNVFAAAARQAGLPDWPVTRAEAIGEHEEEAAAADAWSGVDGDDA
ncbi:MAG TPA: hypothetical protein VNQ73_00925 [Ilumatobacter sp.]|nr:hypothetical protein [Ilumatobacter sp.]